MISFEHACIAVVFVFEFFLPLKTVYIPSIQAMQLLKNDLCNVQNIVNPTNEIFYLML